MGYGEPSWIDGPNERAWSWDNEHDVDEWHCEAWDIAIKALPHATEELINEYYETFYDEGPEEGPVKAEEELEKNWMHYKLTPMMKEVIGF